MLPNHNTNIPEKQDTIFFSLVDYRNNYFINSNTQKIIEFYNSFSDKKELIQWMEERPKGNYVLKENEGSKEIIVVIPTIDANGKLAENCKKNIFTGLHIIFVESGYNNFYFNYSYNCNVGIKKAMEYNPKWIILSNDDMYKVDDVSILIKSLMALDPKKIFMAFPTETMYHSVTTRISKARILRKYALLSIIPLLAYKKRVKLKEMVRVTLSSLRLEKKFGCEYFANSPKDLQTLIYKPGFIHKCYMDFAIISASMLNYFSDSPLDDTFIDAYEDHDLSFKFFLENLNYALIDYKIGDYIGSSMGTGISRKLRNIAGLAYLNYKYSNKLSGLRESKR